MTDRKKPKKEKREKLEKKESRRPQREKSIPLGHFAICPGGGSLRHSHHYDVACEVHRSAKPSYFITCGDCFSRCFLNKWADDCGYTIVEVESRPNTRVLGVTPARRVELLGQLGLRPAAPPADMVGPPPPVRGHYPSAPAFSGPPADGPWPV